MRISVKGTKELSARLAKASAQIRQEVDEEIGLIAAELEADIVLSIQQGPKTGRVYQRGNVVHQASKAGETPASDTGTLLKSIYSEKEREMTWTVGSRLVYALYLEFGTRRMGARPFFRPAVERIRPEFGRRMEAVMLRVLQ